MSELYDMIHLMIKMFSKHFAKFTLYILSGGTAAIVDISIYSIMLYLGVWYIEASIISGVCAFFTAFLLHKYIVYKKRSTFMKHLLRYFVIDMCNLSIITFLLYLLVQFMHIDPFLAKFIALAPVLLWNFFIYKFVVYI